MARTVLRLETDDVWRTLDKVDPVAVLAEVLIKRTIGHADRTRASALPSEPLCIGDDEYVLAEDVAPGVSCAIPAASLRAVHVAALAALATHELLAPGGVTVAMLGTAEATQSRLSVLARHVPDIVHVAVHLTDEPDDGRLDARLVDQLDFAGIGLSVVPSLVDSLFGANLVIAVSEDVLTEGPGEAPVSHLVRGTLLVNASGHDLPTALVDRADQIYVDDLALLPEHADRYVVAKHVANTGTRTPGPTRPPAIAADLGLLLAGTRPGREHQDDIVVVELLSADAPNPELARKIAEVAMHSGLGVQVPA
jgi:ornithine cyclodeaminase/alanine dehydrogenase-like protein (mu-crystallin family)